MASPNGAPRQRRDAQDTRRRILDAAIATVVDVGYYKASSNEIARRAGVTWGSIQHLFGSREQLMLDVVNDIGITMEQRVTNATLAGTNLEERLWSMMCVLAEHYEQPAYLVQVQILLDLSANPNMRAGERRELRRTHSEAFDRLAQALLQQALGDVAAEEDLCLFAFMTLRGYLSSWAIARLIAEFPDDAIVKLVRNVDDAAMRKLLVHSIATTIRESAHARGYDLD
jgi:AcrR family transcriptional regulator